MLCDRILGNLASSDPAPFGPGRAVDYLDVTWTQLNDRAIKSRTRRGRPVAVLLPLGDLLRHGDILWIEDSCVIAVNLLPTEVLVGHPANPRQMGLAAAELGNLHFPIEIRDEEIVTLPDGPAIDVFRRYEVPCRRDSRRFNPIRSSVLNSVRLADGFQVRREPQPASL